MTDYIDQTGEDTMPAEVTIKQDGTAEMFYAGNVPWHGLGTQVEKELTAEQAIAAAGLDWEVSTQAVYINQGNSKVRIPNKAAVVRQDTGDVFNVLGDGWTPVQNRDAFQFFDGVVGSGEAIYHTAGSLRGGRVVWILAKLPDDLKITDADLYQKYILLCNGHDGSRAFQMRVTPVRVVCNNTLTFALERSSDRFWASHTQGVMNRITTARDTLGLADAQFQLMMRGLERMADHQLAEAELQQKLRYILELPELRPGKEADPLKGSPKYAMDTLLTLYHHDPRCNMPGTEGTSYSLLQATTAYVDHIRPVGGKLDTAGSAEVQGERLYQSWFASGKGMKERAWKICLPAGRK